MGGSIDMNIGVLIKSVVVQLIPKYSQSYANLNVKSRSKFKIPYFSVFHLDVNF